MKTSKLVADALLQARVIHNIVRKQQLEYPNSYLQEVAQDQVEALLRLEGAIIALESMQPVPTEGAEAPELSEVEHFMTLPSRNEKENIEV